MLQNHCYNKFKGELHKHPDHCYIKFKGDLHKHPVKLEPDVF